MPPPHGTVCVVLTSRMKGRPAPSGNGSTASQYYLYNHRGDVVGVTDSSGVLKALYEYDAYGNVTASDNSGGGAGPEEILFTGKDKDDVSGLYYFNARWYDPELGRYISRTPLAPNVEKPYLFCEDNPVGFVDLSGYNSTKPDPREPPDENGRDKDGGPRKPDGTPAWEFSWYVLFKGILGLGGACTLEITFASVCSWIASYILYVDFVAWFIRESPDPELYGEMWNMNMNSVLGYSGGIGYVIPPGPMQMQMINNVVTNLGNAVGNLWRSLPRGELDPPGPINGPLPGPWGPGYGNIDRPPWAWPQP